MNLWRNVMDRLGVKSCCHLIFLMLPQGKEADAVFSGFAPSLEVGMNGAPFGEITRQGTPGTTGALHIEDGTKNIVQVHFARCCAFTGAFRQEKEGRKLLASDIVWVGFSVHINNLQQRLFVHDKKLPNGVVTGLAKQKNLPPWGRGWGEGGKNFRVAATTAKRHKR